MGETYYEVLGVAPDATQAEITAAYRQRVLETHPDRNDDPDAAERFKRVTAAEDVLGNEAERARYDRLGHDAYVRLHEFEGEAGFDVGTASGPDSSRQRRAATSAAGAGERTAAGGGNASERGSARQRRRRRTTAESSTAEWFLGDDRETGADRTDRTAEDGRDGSFGGYSVHGWDDEVDLEDDRPPMDESTWIVVGCFTLLYPVFVYASVAPDLPLVVNGTVAACTLLLVGYLLTIPRIAMAVFGGWSLLAPVGLPRVTGLEPLSLLGTLAIGAFWVPFGYAVAVWWVLQR